MLASFCSPRLILVHFVNHNIMITIILLHFDIRLTPSYHRHSNTKVRKTTAKFICASVENYGHSKLMHANKDLLERTLVAVVQLAGDSVPEARYYARCCLNQLWPLPEFDSTVSRLLSDQMRRRAKEAVDILKTKVSIVCISSAGRESV